MSKKFTDRFHRRDGANFTQEHAFHNRHNDIQNKYNQMQNNQDEETGVINNENTINLGDNIEGISNTNNLNQDESMNDTTINQTQNNPNNGDYRREIEVLAHKCKKQEEELKAAQNEVLRLHADNINTANRLRKQIDDAGKFAISSLAKDMAEVLENLYRAKMAATIVDNSGKNENKNPDAQGQINKMGDDAINKLIEGIDLTIQSMTNILAKHGIKRIWPIGQKMDPSFHEVISCIPSPGNEDNTILEVIKAGYEANGRVISPALVVIAQN